MSVTRSSPTAYTRVPKSWVIWAGYLFIPIGMFMFADADVVMRCYGDERAALIEFIIGVIAVVIATVSLYIAGMLRDRRIQAEFARRRVERERRRAERENRGW